jgi:hypothetical protein
VNEKNQKEEKKKFLAHLVVERLRNALRSVERNIMYWKIKMREEKEKMKRKRASAKNAEKKTLFIHFKVT